MGSLGFPELLVIFVVALIVFGPRRLPEIGRTLGKALNEFRRATDELKNSLEREVRADEFRKLTDPTVSRSEPVIDVAAAEGGPAPETTQQPPAVS